MLEAWRLVLGACRCGIVGQKKFLYGAAGVFLILLKNFSQLARYARGSSECGRRK